MQIVQIATLIATVLTAGWFAAYFTQLIKRPQWPSYVKLILTTVIAALVGLATAWITGDLTHFITVWKQGGVTSDQFLVLATLIFTSAQTWYKVIWPGDKWVETVGNVGVKNKV